MSKLKLAFVIPDTEPNGLKTIVAPEVDKLSLQQYSSEGGAPATRTDSGQLPQFPNP